MIDRSRIIALAWGGACHGIFALAGGAMVLAMYFGMSRSLGPVPYPWAWAVNLLLLVQFPIGHSLLLTGGGQRLLGRLAPGGHGKTLATTTYATIASVQLFVLFAFWSPTGVIWWQADGPVLWLFTGLYAGAWGLLTKASFDAGPEVQSGVLGWSSLWRGRRPVFPPMPETGLFRVVRQPIYVSFALTLWTVPVWTPDQLFLAVSYTAYCVAAPRLKERRFSAMFGDRFARYRARIPYMIPRPGKRWPE